MDKREIIRLHAYSVGLGVLLVVAAWLIGGAP